jgi:DNA-binding transcriptional MocR family regulator
MHTGVAGRVIRFDSLSKVLSAGMRLGFASGPPVLIRAIDLHVRTAASIFFAPSALLTSGTDGHGEPAVAGAHAGTRALAALRVGIRRLRRAHTRRECVLCAQARRVCCRNGAPPLRARGVDRARGGHVRLVRHFACRRR